LFRSENANFTRIQLEPLSGDEIVDYVAATLYRSREYVAPLAAVVHEKTLGNPFLLREVLDACHRKNCIWWALLRDLRTTATINDSDLREFLGLTGKRLVGFTT
jgi:predicted ATPase